MLSFEIVSNIIMANLQDSPVEFVETVVKLSLVNKSFAYSVSMNMKDFEFCKKAFEKYVLKYRSVPDCMYSFGDNRLQSKRSCYFDSVLRQDYKTLQNPEDTVGFVKFARQCLVLQHSPFCSMCHRNYRGGGYPRDVLKPFWMLGMRICKLCMKESFISSRRLYAMGLRLDMEIQDGKTSKFLLEKLAGKVFCFRLYRNDSIEGLGNGDDSSFNYGKKGYLMFWKKGLEKLIDFEHVSSEFREKRREGTTILAYIKRLRIQKMLNFGLGLRYRDHRSIVTINYLYMTDRDRNMFLLDLDGCSRQVEKADILSAVDKRRHKWARRFTDIVRKYHNVGTRCTPGKHAMERIHAESYEALAGRKFHLKSFKKAFEREVERRVEAYQHSTFAIC